MGKVVVVLLGFFLLYLLFLDLCLVLYLYLVLYLLYLLPQTDYVDWQC